MSFAGSRASKPALLFPLVLLLAFAPACLSFVVPPYTRPTSNAATPALVGGGSGAVQAAQHPQFRQHHRRRLAQDGSSASKKYTIKNTCAETLIVGFLYLVDKASACGEFEAVQYEDSWLCVEGYLDLRPGERLSSDSEWANFITLFGTTTTNAPYGATAYPWLDVLYFDEDKDCSRNELLGCLSYLLSDEKTTKLYCEAGSPSPSPVWWQAPAPSPSYSSSGSSSGGVNLRVVMGALGGALAALALALAVVFCFCKRRRQHLQQQVESGVSTSLDDEKLEATTQHPDPPPPPCGGKGDGYSVAAALVDPADGYQGFGTDSTEGDQGGTGKGWGDAVVSAAGSLAVATAFAAGHEPRKEAAPEAASEVADSMDEIICNPEQQTLLDVQYQQYQEWQCQQYTQGQGAEASVLSTYPTRPPGGPPAYALSLMGGNVADTQQQAQQHLADVQDQQQTDVGPSESVAIEQAASLPRSVASAGLPATPDASAAPHLSVASTATTTATTATAATDSSTSNASALLSEDPILTYIITKLPTTLHGQSSAPVPHDAPGGAPAPRHAVSALAATAGSGAVDGGRWEVFFQELSIVKPIGEGSFGRVYLALWNQTSVALKILIDREALHREQARGGEGNEALMLPPELQAKLNEEASLMAGMRHPHVVSFLGVCRTPPCLLTEYCSRGSLSDVLARARRDATLASRLTWRRRLHMALDAALGMLYLHTRQPPIVHRDLKSPNLLVDEGWRVKVSDFNLSRILEEGGRSSSMAAMNPRWLAPEVMRAGRATQASDVFAFGVIMWELLTWQLPWTSGECSGWQLVNLVMNGARLEVPPRDKLPGPGPLPAAGLDTYVALLRECWAEEALARPSFADVTVRLRELAEQVADVEPQP